MTLKQHLKMAKLVNKIKQFVDVKTMKSFMAVKSMLDDDYQAQIDEKQFKKYGHIYYGGKWGEKS